MAAPCVGIGLPVYNGERYLHFAIESILAQSFGDFTLLIADNCSTDSTQQICESFAAQDRRVQYVRSDMNRGAAWNFNRAFHLTSGAYFKWASYDDVLEPEYLARCLAVLERDPSVVLCHTRARLIDEEGNAKGLYPFNSQYSGSEPEAHLRFSQMIDPLHWCLPVFGLIRRDVLGKTPLIGTHYGSDRVLLAWLSLLGRFHELPEVLFVSRHHAAQSNRMTWNPLAYMAWYAPRYQNAATLPYWIEFSGYVQAIRTAPLSQAHKLRCYAHLLNPLRQRQRAKNLLKDLLVFSALTLTRPFLKRDQVRTNSA